MKRFSQFVLDSIRSGDFAITNAFMGPNYIVNKARIERSRYRGYADEPENEMEWGVSLGSWWWGLFPSVNLYRGTKYHGIKLSKHEHRALAMAVRAVFELQDARNKERKIQLKLEKERAYYVDGLDAANLRLT